MDPTPVTHGAGIAVTATLKLIRPAVNRIEVILGLPGTTPLRGNPSMQRVNCVRTSRSVNVKSGSERKNFPIFTGSRQIRVGETPTAVQMVFTITARYVSERVSTTFTANGPQ